ncbi:MAG: TIGR03560 family F420-dependent LLM class oxidoreductase [Chloroflexota bacterium]
MEVAIMIEGQDGLTWARWQRLAAAVEDLGFVGLYRSDHYTNARPPDKDSLELWVSLTWLASHTQRIEFGPLVTPVSFRHPTMTVRMATAVDELSGGRLTLGVGAGWQEREHTNYGWDLLDLPDRFDRFEEGLEIMTHLLKKDAPLDFTGTHFQLNEARLLPRPARPDGPPIAIGGNGLHRTLPLVARYADEWNGLYLLPEQVSERNNRLDTLLAEQGREANSVRRSWMGDVIFGRDESDLQIKLQGRDASEMRQQSRLVGTASAVVDQLGELAEAGVQRVMLQWLDQDDMDRLEALAQSVLPHVQ